MCCAFLYIFRKQAMPAEAHDIEQPLMRNGGDAKNPGFGYSASLMFQHPAKTLKWIEQCGCKKLGDFTVQVRSRRHPGLLSLSSSACAYT